MVLCFGWWAAERAGCFFQYAEASFSHFSFNAFMDDLFVFVFVFYWTVASITKARKRIAVDGGSWVCS